MNKLKIIVREHALFVLLLALCLILRLVPLFNYQFTLDEISALDRIHFDSFGGLIDKGVKIDAHPALIQVLIWFLVRCFGCITWIIKLPFLLFGFGAVVYAYRFSLRNFSKQAAVFSALIFSFSLMFVFYAPIARMYIAGVFFSMALLFYFFEIFFSNHYRLSSYIFFGLFALLSALNQHINALFAFTVAASGFLFLTKNTARPYLITCLLTVIFYLPHLPVTLYQLGIGGIGYEQGGWLTKPDLGSVGGFLKILLGTGRTYLLFCVIAVVAVLLNRRLMFNKRQVFLLALFLINFLIVYGYSIVRAPVFQNSVMLFSGTAFIVALTPLLTFNNQRWFYGAFMLLFAALFFKTYVKKNYLHQCVKTIFEYQFERTSYYKQLYGNKAITAVFFDADQTMENIYFSKYKRFDCKIVSDAETQSMEQFTKFVAGLQSDYLVLASSFPAQQALVKDYFPYLVENTQTQAINYKVYSRRAEDKTKTVSDDEVLKFSDAEHPDEFKYTKLKPQFIAGNSLQVPVDSVEFPFDAEADYNSIIDREGEVLLLKNTFKLKRPESQVISCIAVNDVQNSTGYMYNSKEVKDYVLRPDSTVTVYADNFFGTQHNAAKDHSKITCYIWNRGKESFALTGFEIKVINYWPQKWRFWE